MQMNHPELVYSYPPNLVPPAKMQLEKVRYSRTIQNQC